MTRFLAVCHALSIGCNTGKSGVSMTSIAPEIPEIHKFTSSYDENMILKNLVLCVVRAYFEISISLKVYKKVYSGIAGWKRIWNVLKPAE